MDNKRKLMTSETEKSSKIKKKNFSSPNFSIGARGRDALLCQENREPLLITDLHSYLQRLLTPWYQQSYYPSIGWCSLQNLGSISKHLFIIVDGVSLFTFKNLHERTKNAAKKRKNKISSKNDENSGKKSLKSKSQVKLSNSEMEPLVDNYSKTVKRLLPSLATFTAVEVVSPVVYNHKLLQDLFYIKICDEPLLGPKVKTVPNIAYLHERLKIKSSLSIPDKIDSTKDRQCKTTDVPYDQNLYWKRCKTDSLAHSDKFDRRKLCTCVDLSEFYENNKKSSNNESSFLFTKDAYVQVSPSSPLFAVDCEFVSIKEGENALASIAIVNEAAQCIYSTLVMPSYPITDYRSEYSGITEKLLKNVTVSLEDVQNEIRKNLPPDAILVGHSLNNDLNALKMRHPFVIDSSLIFNTKHHGLDKLKKLAEVFLGRDIQKESRVGHDPLEDALSALDLVKLKLQNDEAYGNLSMGGVIPKHTSKVMSVVNIFDVRKTRKLERERLSVYCTNVNSKDWTKLVSSETRLVTSDSNENLVKAVKEQSGGDHFLFVHLQAEKEIRSIKMKKRTEALSKLNSDLSALMEEMPSHCSISVLCANSSRSKPPLENNNAFFLLSVR